MNPFAVTTNPFLFTTFCQGPVHALQEMLRTIAFVDRSLPFLRPSGRFDEATLEAVMRFQRDHGLPVTGVVDRQNWNAIMAQFLRAWGTLSPPAILSLFPPQSPDIQPGQAAPLLPLAQTIFQNLSEVLAGVIPAPVTGVLDEATVQNVHWVQDKAELPSTGCLDRPSWAVLVRLFETFVVPGTPTEVPPPETKAP